MVLTQQAGNEEYPALDIMFPYHYGSYATLAAVIAREGYERFHTTMVHTRAVLR